MTSLPRNDAVPGPAGLHLLVAIPALNEERTIARVVRGIPDRIEGVGAIEVLVIDDGSSDRTGAIAAEAGAYVIRNDITQGLGAAFQSAMTHAVESGADVVVTLDADGQFDPADIAVVAGPVLRGEADFATASRFKDPALVPPMPWVKRFGNRMMSLLISRLTGRRFHDVSCGMRCYHRRAALQLYLLARFTYTQEVFLNLCFHGLRIVEVPVRVRGEREFGKSRVAGSLWRYTARTAYIIVRSYRDYRPMHFFGGIAACLLAASGSLGTFFLIHYLQTGRFRPHTWAGVTAGALFFLAVIALLMAILGDMLNRHRTYLEEILYRQRLAAPQNREGSSLPPGRRLASGRDAQSANTFLKAPR